MEHINKNPRRKRLGIYPLAIKLAIEQHIENDESYYLATSPDIQGLVAEGKTLAETIEIAQDLAKLILQDKRGMAVLPKVPKRLSYSLVVDY